LFYNGWRRNIAVKTKTNLIYEFAILSSFLVANRPFLMIISIQEMFAVVVGMELFVIVIGKDHRISTNGWTHELLQMTPADCGVYVFAERWK